jgi:hypothetical protein
LCPFSGSRAKYLNDYENFLSGPEQNRTATEQNRTATEQKWICEGRGTNLFATRRLAEMLVHRPQDTALLESNRSGGRRQRGFGLGAARRREAAARPVGEPRRGRV